MDDTHALCTYYAWRGLGSHVRMACADARKKAGADPLLSYWDAFGMMLLGDTTEAAREFKSLENNRDTRLAVAVAMAWLLTKSKLIDREAITRYERLIASETDTASDVALCHAARACMHLAQTDRAREILQVAARLNSPDAAVLRGWLDLTLATAPGGREAQLKAAAKALDASLEAAGPSPPLALQLARLICLRLTAKHAAALDLANQLCVGRATCLPAQAERVLCLIALGDWDGAWEAAQALAGARQLGFFGMAHALAIGLARRHMRPADAAPQVAELRAALLAAEPRHASLLRAHGAALARLVGTDAACLAETTALVDAALAAATAASASAVAPADSGSASTRGDDEVVACLTELGAQQLAAGAPDRAVAPLERALALAPDAAPARLTLCRALLALGRTREADTQHALLRDVAAAGAASSAAAPAIALLAAELALAQTAASDSAGPEAAFASLDAAASAILDAARPGASASAGAGAAHGWLGAVLAAEPWLAVAVARALVDAAAAGAGGGVPAADEFDSSSGGGSSGIALAAAPAALARAAAVADGLRRLLPTLSGAVLVSARVRALLGQLDAARALLAALVAAAPDDAEAQLLLANVLLREGRTRAAAAALESALAASFRVRESPAYHAAEAAVLQAQGRHADAAATLEAAMALPGVGRAASTAAPRVSLAERAALLVALPLAKARAGAAHEALKAAADALTALRGTAEETAALIAQARVALIARADVDAALAALARADPARPHYLAAKKLQADVLLEHRGDRRRFTQTLKALAEARPSLQSYLLLGDGYMRVQEPDSAIAVYTAAQQLEPNSLALAERIGAALLATHDYAKACAYFEAALRSDPSRAALACSLAAVHVRLRQLDEAERVLTTALQRQAAPTASEAVGDDRGPLPLVEVDLLLLLAETRAKRNPTASTLPLLEDARTRQRALLSRVRVEAPDLAAAQSGRLARVCVLIAQQHAAQPGSREPAMAAYREALEADAGCSEAQVALARLHLARGEHAECQRHCLALLRQDPAHEAASLLLADVLLQRGDTDGALYHYGQMLSASPRSFAVLARYVDLARCAGRLAELEPLFADAGAASGADEAGWHYCHGLYLWAQRQPHEAMSALNRARTAPAWRDRALRAMAELAVNADGRVLGATTLASEARDTSPTARAERVAALATARELIEALPRQTTPPAVLAVLQARCLLAAGGSADVRAAAALVEPVLEREPRCASALYVRAVCQALSSQRPAARATLEAIVGTAQTASGAEFGPDEGRLRTQATLLLADLCCEAGDGALAQSLLEAALARDASLAPAWEALGAMHERAASWAGAAAAYERAWQLTRQSAPAVGFKLAANLLKCMRPLDAIDVCHAVLAAQPDYVEIRKQVLEPARKLIKP